MWDDVPLIGHMGVVYFYSVQDVICINITRKYYHWKMLELKKRICINTMVHF